MKECIYFRALIASMLVQAIGDLKIKDYSGRRRKHSWFIMGCLRRAKKFILSRTFMELCEEVDFDGNVIRKKLKTKHLL